MDNPYAALGQGSGTGSDNPYANLGGKSSPNFVATDYGKTPFEKIKNAKYGTTDENGNPVHVGSDQSSSDSKNFSIAGETMKGLPSAAANFVAHPINTVKTAANAVLPDEGNVGAETVKGIPGAAFNLAAQFYQHPVDSTVAETQGLIKGSTLGGAEYGLGKLADYTKSLGLPDEHSDSIRHLLDSPKDNNELTGINQGFDIAGQMNPYILTDKLLSKGMVYAAPTFVAKYGKLAQGLADTVGFNALGQTAQTFQAPEMRDRATQAKIDTAMGAAGPLIGSVYRAVKNNAFKAVRNIEPIAVDATTHMGDIPKGSSPPTSLLTAEGPEGKKMTVATNNSQALQNTLKGSANMKIEVKPSVTLGEDKGVPITARHFFNEKTGEHIIQVTNQADAATVAHELGHAINDELAGKVRGFTDYLSGDLVKAGASEESTARMFKAQGKVEDALSSYATERLAQEHSTITNAMVNEQMTKDIAAMKKEIDDLAAERPGRVKDTPSERFSDAIAVLTTNKTAAEVAPVLKAFLEHSKLYSSDLKDVINSSFKEAVGGEKIAKNSEKVAAPAESKAAPVERPDVVSVNGQQYQLKGSALEKYKEATTNYEKKGTTKIGMSEEQHGKMMKGEGMKLSALKRELTGQYTPTELNNLIEHEKSNYIGKEVRVTMNGKEVSATIASKPSYGKYQVALSSDGSILKGISKEAIRDPRTPEMITKELTSRGDAKLFGAEAPKVEAPVEKPVEKTAEPAPKKEEALKETPAAEGEKVKVVEKAPELERTPTGKQPESEPLKAENLTKDTDLEVFINTKILPQMKGKYRIGKSNQDIIDRAMDSKMTEEGFNNILKERFGNLSEDLLKGVQIMNEKASALKDEIAGRSMSSFSPDEQVSFLQRANQVREMYEVYSGARTELSNSFRTLSITADQVENDTLRNMFETVYGATSKEAEAIRIAQGITKSVELTTGQKFARGAAETWYASILSGPKTHLRNIISNISNITTELVSKSVNPMAWKEVGPAIKGIGEGLKEEWSKIKSEFIKTIKLQQDARAGEGKFGTFDAINPMENRVWGEKGSLHKFGQIVEAVGHLLQLEDNLGAAAARGMEKASLKVYNPEMSDKVMQAVSDYFAEQTMYHGMPKGALMRGMVRGAEALRKEAPLTKLIIPFVKTVGNVLDRQLDYIPLVNLLRLKDSHLERQVLEIAKTVKGGLTEDEKGLVMKRLRDQQMGRMYLGLGLTAAAVEGAKAGVVSGAGPSNFDQRTALEATGWRANSIKIGNTWIPYTYLGPLGGIFSAAGNIHDSTVYDGKASSNVADLAMKGMLGWTQTQLNQSFLSGASDLIDMIKGNTAPKTYFDKTVSNLVPIPALYSQTKDILGNLYSKATGDKSTNYTYQTRGIIDAIRVKLGLTGSIGGLADPLNPKIDSFGRPMTSDLIYGLSPSTEDKSVGARVDNFLAANDMYVTIPKLATKYADPNGGEKRALTKNEFYEFTVKSGKEIYKEINDRIPSWQHMDPKEREKEKRALVSNIRSTVRDEIMRKNRVKQGTSQTVVQFINSI